MQPLNFSKGNEARAGAFGPRVKTARSQRDSSDWKTPTAHAIRVVHELLLTRYGAKTAREREPLDGLIVIMLSQATNDVNCDRAFRQLKSTFPTWDEVRLAPVEAIADAIRAGGLANQKAARIKELLEKIHEEQGNLDLGWMHSASGEECRAFLQGFKGVGPKTIACVLLFFLDKPAFPVDTHVQRVTKRLGWIREKASLDEAHCVLEVAVPDDCKMNLHVNLIQHGRTLCRPDGQGGPQCETCPLLQHCAYAKAHNKKSDSAQLKASQSTLAADPAAFFVTVLSE